MESGHVRCATNAAADEQLKRDIVARGLLHNLVVAPKGGFASPDWPRWC